MRSREHIRKGLSEGEAGGARRACIVKGRGSRSRIPDEFLFGEAGSARSLGGRAEVHRCANLDIRTHTSTFTNPIPSQPSRNRRKGLCRRCRIKKARPQQGTHLSSLLPPLLLRVLVLNSQPRIDTLERLEESQVRGVSDHRELQSEGSEDEKQTESEKGQSGGRSVIDHPVSGGLGSGTARSKAGACERGLGSLPRENPCKKHAMPQNGRP